MEHPATTNPTTTKRASSSSADLTAVPLLQAMLDQLRGELAIARVALDIEWGAVRALKRDRAAEIKAVRDEEARKCRNAINNLKSRLERDHEEALQHQKDIVTKTLNAELVRTLKAKDAELRQELAEVHAREEDLKVQIRDALRANRDVGTLPQSGAIGGDTQKLQQEVSALRLQNKQLEDRTQVVVEADRQKAADLRSQHEEHAMQLVQMKKSSQQETHRLLEELKSKDRLISQLERQLSVQTGRVEEQREKLLERHHEPHPRDCDCSEENCARARERRLIQRLAELQTSMKRAAETHAQEKKEMIRKLRESEGKSPTSRQPQKNSKNAKRNTQAASTATVNEETVTLDNVGNCNDNQSYQSDQELEKLRIELQEKDRTILNLLQAAREKDQKLDHLTNRHRKEQMRQYYRQFMELEPVAELEEDSGAGEDDSASSGSPSLSPQPYSGDMWTELNNKEYHDTLYSCLLKEHLELQREYKFLQTRLKKEMAEPNRIRLRLEHELAGARTQVRELKRMLAEQRGGSIVMAERLAALQAEAHDLREQNELLEFRILELEECHDNLSVKSHGPDTRDVWTDTENDDVSDSGVHSLPTSEDISSDIDLGIHDIKLELKKEELKSRLLELAKTSSSTKDRCCLQQVLALLESYESRVEKLEELQDEPCSTVTSENPSTRGSVDTGVRGLKNLPESTSGTLDTSKFTSRIIATVLPFTDQIASTNDSSNDGTNEREELKKQLKNAECLQESGIFEDTEFNSQGTQTDSVVQVISEFKSPFESGVVGDLSAEIQKLNQFRELVEERGSCCGNKKLLRVEEGYGDGQSIPCAPNLKELQYCKERLQLLEDKVRVYESSGEVQVRLLTDRLQKEVRLSAQVKELSAKVEQLIAENRRLEEEKCEFEEAENDTRLKCQKLEVKLVALNEKKSDLQAQLQQERCNMSRLRNNLSETERKKDEARDQLNYLKVMLNKYEHRNYVLEEQEVDLRHRLEMLEKSMPVLTMWNIWRMVQDLDTSSAEGTPVPSSSQTRTCDCTQDDYKSDINRRIVEQYSKSVEGLLDKERPKTSPELRTGICPPCSREDTARQRRLEEEEQHLLMEQRETEEMWYLREAQLKSRIQDLEALAEPMTAEIQSCRETIERYELKIKNLENMLHGTKSGITVPDVATFNTKAEMPLQYENESNFSEPVKCGDPECMTKLQKLTESEADLKKRLNELESKEKAYMETLQQADNLWSEMENSYKKRISKAEDKEAALHKKIKKLEESESKLRQTFEHEEENDILLDKLQNVEKNGKILTEKIRVLESEKNQLLEETKQLRDALQSIQAERAKELVESPLKEELQKEKKLSKGLRDEISCMEKELQEVTIQHKSEIKCLQQQLTKKTRLLTDVECTNSELKEEVDTLEAKVCELKAVIEKQKQNEEKIVIQMSQTILEKELEVEETKREMQYLQIPSAKEELSQVDRSVLPDVKISSDMVSEQRKEPVKSTVKPTEGAFVGMCTKKCWSGCKCAPETLPISEMEEINVPEETKKQFPDIIKVPEEIKKQLPEMIKVPEEMKKQSLETSTKVCPDVCSGGCCKCNAVQQPPVASAVEMMNESRKIVTDEYTVPKSEQQSVEQKEMLPEQFSQTQKQTGAEVSVSSFQYSESEYSRITAEDFPFGEAGECILEHPIDPPKFTDSELEMAFHESDIEDVVIGSKECLFQDEFPGKVDTVKYPIEISADGKKETVESIADEIHPTENENIKTDEDISRKQEDKTKLPVGAVKDIASAEKIKSIDSEEQDNFSSQIVVKMGRYKGNVRKSIQKERIRLKNIAQENERYPSLVPPVDASKSTSQEHTNIPIFSKTPEKKVSLPSNHPLKSKSEEELWPNFIDDSCNIEIQDDISSSLLYAETNRVEMGIGEVPPAPPPPPPPLPTTNTGINPETGTEESDTESYELDDAEPRFLTSEESKFKERPKITQAVTVDESCWSSFVNDVCNIELEEDLEASPMTYSHTSTFFKSLRKIDIVESKHQMLKGKKVENDNEVLQEIQSFMIDENFWPNFINDSCNIELKEDLVESPMTYGHSSLFLKSVTDISKKLEVPEKYSEMITKPENIPETEVQMKEQEYKHEVETEITEVLSEDTEFKPTTLKPTTYEEPNLKVINSECSVFCWSPSGAYPSVITKQLTTKSRSFLFCWADEKTIRPEDIEKLSFVKDDVIESSVKEPAPEIKVVEQAEDTAEEHMVEEISPEIKLEDSTEISPEYEVAEKEISNVELITQEVKGGSEVFEDNVYQSEQIETPMKEEISEKLSANEEDLQVNDQISAQSRTEEITEAITEQQKSSPIEDVSEKLSEQKQVTLEISPENEIYQKESQIEEKIIDQIESEEIRPEIDVSIQPEEVAPPDESIQTSELVDSKTTTITEEETPEAKGKFVKTIVENVVKKAEDADDHVTTIIEPEARIEEVAAPTELAPERRREPVETMVTPEVVGMPGEADATIVLQLQTLMLEKAQLQEQVQNLEQEARRKSVEMLQLKTTISVLNKKLIGEVTDFPSTSAEIVATTLEWKESVPSVEDLQDALDMMKTKCRTKDQMITALANELQLRSASGQFEDLLNKVILIDKTSPPVTLQDFDKKKLCDYLKNPKEYAESVSSSKQDKGIAIVVTVVKSKKLNANIQSQDTAVALFQTADPSISQQVQTVHSPTDMRVPSPTNLQVLRQMGPDSILLGWNVPPGANVAGFEIYINGSLVQKVESPSCNKALLQNLDLKSKIVVTIFALTPQGQFSEPAEVVIDEPSV